VRSFLTLFNLQGTLVVTNFAALHLPGGRYPLRSVAPPLQIKPASLGFDLIGIPDVFAVVGGF